MFADLNLAAGIDGQPLILTGAQAIDNSLYNLCMSLPGTVGWKPAYGTEVRRLIWEPVCDDTARRLAVTLRHGVAQYEPRIVLVGGGLDITPMADGQGYKVVFVYRIKATGQRATTSFSLFR